MQNAADARMENRTRAFPLGPDNTALFPGREYRRAITGLREGMERGCRLMCLVGPAGIGKSMLLRSLRGQLPRGFIHEISQPPLGGVLSRLAAGLGLDVAGDEEAAVQRRIREYFAASRPKGAAVIQVIDDAETLSRDDLALVRRLFDPVRGQILLAGQPQLLSLFSADDGTWTVTQPDRIYYLEPLLRDEIGAYIRHRLNEAGFDRELFEPEAITAVAAYSGGVPRLINLLCFTALASAEFDVSTPISVECIHEAARQRMEIGNYPFPSPPSASGWRPVPSPALRAASEPNRDSGDVDETMAFIAGERRLRGERSVRFGPGRVLLSLMVGAAVGIAITRLSLMGIAGLNILPHASAAAVSHSVEPYVQRMKAGLVDMAEWIIAWAGPESSSVNDAGTAQVGDATATVSMTAGAAIHGEDAPSPAAAAQQGDKSAPPTTNASPPAVAAARAPAALPARAAAVDSVKAAGDAAPEKAKEAADIAEAASGQGGSDSAGIAQRNQDDEAAARLTIAQREHIARLYAERAQYDIQSGRLQDAWISIRRGLRLAPNDAGLRELKRSVPTGQIGQIEEQMPQDIPSSLPVRIDPPRNEITRLDMRRTRYKWPNQRRDALLGIGYGIQAAPDGGAAPGMKLQAQKEVERQK